MSDSPPVLRGDTERLARLRGFLLDLDGTTYLGDRLLPGADRFVRRLAETGRKRLFITNNCSRTPEEYAAKLARLGLPAVPGDVFTSGELAGRFLLERGLTRVYVLGTPSLVRQLAALGVEHDERSPRAVLSSFDLTLTYERLLKAVRFVQAGLPLYSTHPDLVCPTPDGPIPDSGLITSLIERTTGVKAHYLGKPMVEMVEGAARRLGLDLSELAFVGDRLYTDMRMALDAGITAVLVLSGETTEEMLAESGLRPHVVASDLNALVPLLD